MRGKPYHRQSRGTSNSLPLSGLAERSPNIGEIPKIPIFRRRFQSPDADFDLQTKIPIFRRRFRSSDEDSNLQTQISIFRRRFQSSDEDSDLQTQIPIFR